MSRNAICSSFSCSIVNLMCGSIELSVSWKLVIALTAHCISMNLFACYVVVNEKTVR